MSRHLVVDPVLLFPAHAISTGNLASWTGPVELATLGAVTECFSTPLHDMWLPMIGSDLYSHLAGPKTRQALALEGFRVEPPVTSGPVHVQEWRDTKVGWFAAGRVLSVGMRNPNFPGSTSIPHAINRDTAKFRPVNLDVTCAARVARRLSNQLGVTRWV